MCGRVDILRMRQNWYEMKEKGLFDMCFLSGNYITTIEIVITENVLLRVKNCENETLKWLYLGRTWLYNLRSENMCTQ